MSESVERPVYIGAVQGKMRSPHRPVIFVVSNDVTIAVLPFANLAAIQTRKSLPEIARELGASSMVESSTPWRGSLLRIASRLIRVQAWNQLTPMTTQRAIEHYTRATAIDADYALAWSGLADAYTSAPIAGDRRPSDVWQRAKDAVGMALRGHPDLAEAQTSSGVLKFWLDWDWPGAEATHLGVTS